MTKRFATRMAGDMNMTENAVPVQVKIYYTMDAQIATKIFRKRNLSEASQGNLTSRSRRKRLISHASSHSDRYRY